MSLILLSALILPLVSSLDYDESMIYGSFPEGFKWGAATAAYQVRIENKSTIETEVIS